MSYQVITPATTSLVSVADLKTHLLLFGDTSYDTELQDILLTAEGFVSDFLDDFLATTTVKVNLFVLGDTVLPHKSPTNVRVAYWDDSDIEAPINPSNFFLDTSAVYPRLVFRTKPTNISTEFVNQGFIEYDTVLTPVPAKVKHAVLLIAAELFENRTDSITGTIVAKLPLSSLRLIQSLRGW